MKWCALEAIQDTFERSQPAPWQGPSPLLLAPLLLGALRPIPSGLA